MSTAWGQDPTKHAVRVARAYGYGYGEVRPYDRDTDPGSIVLPLALVSTGDVILATDDDGVYDVLAEWPEWSRENGPDSTEWVVARNLTLDEAMRCAVWFAAACQRAADRAEAEIDAAQAGADW